jgi:hypothetical protein
MMGFDDMIGAKALSWVLNYKEEKVKVVEVKQIQQRTQHKPTKSEASGVVLKNPAPVAALKIQAVQAEPFQNPSTAPKKAAEEDPKKQQAMIRIRKANISIGRKPSISQINTTLNNNSLVTAHSLTNSQVTRPGTNDSQRHTQHHLPQPVPSQQPAPLKPLNPVRLPTPSSSSHPTQQSLFTIPFAQQQKLSTMSSHELTTLFNRFISTIHSTLSAPILSSLPPLHPLSPTLPTLHTLFTRITAGIKENIDAKIGCQGVEKEEFDKVAERVVAEVENWENEVGIRATVLLEVEREVGDKGPNLGIKDWRKACKVLDEYLAKVEEKGGNVVSSSDTAKLVELATIHVLATSLVSMCNRPGSFITPTVLFSQTTNPQTASAMLLTIAKSLSHFGKHMNSLVSSRWTFYNNVVPLLTTTLPIMKHLFDCCKTIGQSLRAGTDPSTLKSLLGTLKYWEIENKDIWNGKGGPREKILMIGGGQSGGK